MERSNLKEDPIHVSAWSNIKLYTAGPKKERNATCKKENQEQNKTKEKEKRKKYSFKKENSMQPHHKASLTNQSRAMVSTGSHASGRLTRPGVGRDADQ